MDLIGAGRSLLIYPRPDEKPHLWFVVTDPVGTPGKVVAVMVQSAKVHTEKTLLLGPGDHPFIRHPTSVIYNTATFFTVEKLQQWFHRGTCHLLQDMSQGLLVKVRKGLLASPFTGHAIRGFCENHF